MSRTTETEGGNHADRGRAAEPLPAGETGGDRRSAAAAAADWSDQLTSRQQARARSSSTAPNSRSSPAGAPQPRSRGMTSPGDHEHGQGGCGQQTGGVDQTTITVARRAWRDRSADQTK